MLVYTWNVNGRRSTPAYLLDALRPDIAFIQEANLPPGFGGPNLIYERVAGHQWGTALYTADLALEPVQLPVPIQLQAPTGWVAAGRAVLPNGSALILISVHAPLFMSRRSGDVFPYLNHLFQDVIHPFVAGTHFIVGGDLNASRLYGRAHPHAYPGGDPHNPFFDWVESHGFVNCHRLFHQDEEQSIWHGNVAPYQDDYLFVSDSLREYVHGCDVLTTQETRARSDHSPVMLTLVSP